MMSMPPLRAVGGNVLLRRVAMDAHRSSLLVLGGKTNAILQLGEVVGLGGRWTQNRPWFPPMPTPHRTPLDNDSWDPEWKAPDLTHRVRPKPANFSEGHRTWLSDLQVGDLVIYVQSRVYDVFPWDGKDYLVYPGDWIHGVVTETAIAEHPELRRYERDEFTDDTPQKNLHA